MVIYKESATRIYAVNARIDRINYQNQLQDRRISACISYSINGKPRTEWVVSGMLRIKTNRSFVPVLKRPARLVTSLLLSAKEVTGDLIPVYSSLQKRVMLSRLRIIIYILVQSSRKRPPISMVRFQLLLLKLLPRILQ